MKEKIIKALVFTTLLFGLTILVNTNQTQAASTTEIYLEAGESYTVSLSTTSPVLYHLTDEDKTVVTASIKSSNLSIKAVAQGTASFYVCKNSASNANIVRTVTVHVYQESTNITPTLKNNVSHSASDSSNYSNQTIYLYNGKSCVVTVVTSNCPTSVSGDTSGKAKAVSASIYECNADGSSITNNTYHFSPEALSGFSRTYNKADCKNSKTPVTTYIRGSAVWYSSNGTAHWTSYKAVSVKIYPTPYLKVSNEAGQSVSTLNLIKGNKVKLAVSLENTQSGDEVSNKSCTALESSKVEVNQNNGYWVVNPIGLTNNATTNITFRYVLENDLTKRNGDSYATFEKTIICDVTAMGTTKITKSSTGTNSITISWNKVTGASKYRVYRSESESSAYKSVAEVSGTSYKDTDVTAGKTYYYKIASMSSSGTVESTSDCYKVTIKKAVKKLKKPGFKITSAKDGVIKVKINKKASKYNAKGFQIKIKRGNKYIITTTNINKTNFKLKGVKSGVKYTIYIRTYKGSKKSKWVSKSVKLS